MTSRFASLTEQDIEKIVECIIKQILDSVFVISRIIKVSVRVISLSLRLRLITPTSTLIILDITKTSSNNCLVFETNQSKCTNDWSVLLAQIRLLNRKRKINIMSTCFCRVRCFYY